MTRVSTSRLGSLSINLFIVLALMSCGSPSGTTKQSNAEEDTRTRLLKMQGDAKTVVVLKDMKDTYWAIPASGIKQIDEGTTSEVVNLSLQEGTRLAVGSGKGTPTQIAEMLISQRTSGGPYFTTMKNEGKEDEAVVSGQVGEAKPGAIIEVKELVLSKVEQ